jgi:uncharacterized protein
MSSLPEIDQIELADDCEFSTLADRAISRRGLLGGAIAFGAAAFLFEGHGAHAADNKSIHAAEKTGGHFGFEPVAANSLDTITLPKGYRWRALGSWGDPLWSSGAQFDPGSRGGGLSSERAIGDNNDGMELFNHQGRTILAVNNEYANLKVAFGNRRSGKPETADDIRKCQAIHGVSIFEIAQRGQNWKIVSDSPFNRRITPNTPMSITGPARGHDLLKTDADPHGVSSRGTWNNCGAGRTPWGAYLTCEENFNGYFSNGDSAHKISAEQKRYGIRDKDRGYGWAREDDRFDVSKHPNEPNRVGYIVEIDPLDPSSTPKKRTALGRFKHENAEVVLAADGHVVVYMGDDERGEFLYKFISAGRYSEGGDNNDLLESGRLFAAKFQDKGQGAWIELTPESTGMETQAEICIHTRLAASAVQATTMDRPEWVAAHPHRAEIYCALTNNKNRGKKPNAGGDETPVGGPNPRAVNKYGQIVRWRPEHGDHLSDAFSWDLFVMAGNPTMYQGDRAGSKNVNALNMFNSPDGLSFDSKGMLWIRTDGNYSNRGDFLGMGNNQMLVGDPASGEIRRFMVGPRQCEVTGLCWSPDHGTLFVGIQHPGGNRGESNFPDGGKSTPRSSVIAITREDGGTIG